MKIYRLVADFDLALSEALSERWHKCFCADSTYLWIIFSLDLYHSALQLNNESLLFLSEICSIHAGNWSLIRDSKISRSQ